MTEVILAVTLVGAAVVAWRRLTAFHPATLWLAAWAFASTLFALRALPYRSLAPETVLIIAGGAVVFSVGTLLGERASKLGLAQRRPSTRVAPPRSVAPAAALAAALACLGLAAFLLQVSASHGWRSALVSDANVRLAIGDGSTAYTIKYIYVAFAAAALAGMAAGRATRPAARRTWIAVALTMIGLQYFSTGRSNILLAAVMACIAYFLSDPRPVDRRRMALVGAAVATSTLAVFLGMGSLLGKSFEASDIGNYDNVFVMHASLRPLALPYQYVTAPLPALDVVRDVTPDTGRGGCRTLSAACSVGQRLGLPVAPEPSLTGYTQAPSAWNTFTALYAPLVDAGRFLGALIIFGQGLLFGLLWTGVRSGSFYAIGVYAAMSSAVVYSTVENTLFQPHLIGAAIIVVVLIAVTAARESLPSRRVRRPS